MKFRTKIPINQEIFTFIVFPNLSPPQRAQKCPNSRPNECLFHFGVSPCLIQNEKAGAKVRLLFFVFFFFVSDATWQERGGGSTLPTSVLCEKGRGESLPHL